MSGPGVAVAARLGTVLQTGTDAGTGTSDGLAALFETLGVPAAYSGVLAGAVRFAVAFLVVYLLGRFVFLRLVSRLLERRDLDEHARRPLLKITRYSVLIVAFAVAFGFGGFGSFLQALATVAAAGTLALGFGMQNVVSNFVAGVFIFTERPFKIGDWIEWDGNSGVVEDISLRVTRVRTFDNELLTVPNSQLSDNVVKNPVAKDQLRLKFLFGIDYEDDIDHATDIIVEEAEKHEGILDDPAPSVRLTELADSYVGLQSRIWIDDPSRSDFVKTRGEYVTAVKKRFDEEGINMPFPTRTLEGGLELAGQSEVPSAADD